MRVNTFTRLLTLHVLFSIFVTTQALGARGLWACHLCMYICKVQYLLLQGSSPLLDGLQYHKYRTTYVILTYLPTATYIRYTLFLLSLRLLLGSPLGIGISGSCVPGATFPGGRARFGRRPFLAINPVARRCATSFLLSPLCRRSPSCDTVTWCEDMWHGFRLHFSTFASHFQTFISHFFTVHPPTYLSQPKG